MVQILQSLSYKECSIITKTHYIWIVDFNSEYIPLYGPISLLLSCDDIINRSIDIIAQVEKSIQSKSLQGIDRGPRIGRHDVVGFNIKR